MTLAQLNALDETRFVATLGGVFEHSPWVAVRVYPQRPFANVDDLHAAMCAEVARSGAERQLALIRAHPQLASKAAQRGELSAASQCEQQGAGLDRCSAEEFSQLQSLNAAYQQAFDFPFILAVRGHSRTSILANLQSRLGHTRDQELAEALRQIERIAGLRLTALIQSGEK